MSPELVGRSVVSSLIKWHEYIFSNTFNWGKHLVHQAAIAPHLFSSHGPTGKIPDQ
jgi:hypothetical protein